ncbi:hypothetical protein [Argonema galeatum]|uniref:hypothetical protein n=1 Tax=Argonema galeatum TaxID=2942762 RepID=UPI0020126E23|nr:hypothetical protein [Argonema galeatum]MCL1466265.1 hypothetical protein [Argonema galeatum A003/A1]
MTQSSLTQEQEAAMTELLELTKDAEEKLREMSKFADAIAEKYQKRLHEITISEAHNYERITG